MYFIVRQVSGPRVKDDTVYQKGNMGGTVPGFVADVFTDADELRITSETFQTVEAAVFNCEKGSLKTYFTR